MTCRWKITLHSSLNTYIKDVKLLRFSFDILTLLLLSTYNELIDLYGIWAVASCSEGKSELFGNELHID